MKLHMPARISPDQRKTRLERLRAHMADADVSAVVIGATTSLVYFTGVHWHPSERFTGIVVTPKGLTYVCPAFERDKVESVVTVPGEFRTWQEDESPYAAVSDAAGAGAGTVALDEQMPLFTYLGLRRAMGDERLVGGGALIGGLRRIKEPAEIALMQHAKDVTLEVQRPRARDADAGHPSQRSGKIHRRRTPRVRVGWRQHVLHRLVRRPTPRCRTVARATRG